MSEIIELLKKGVKKAKEVRVPLGGRIYLTSYWYTWKTFGPKHNWSDYDDTIDALNTPEKAMAWVFANIKYTADKKPEDSWQPAKVTFKRKKADCEDYAVWMAECLSSKYDCVYICMYTKDEGHCELLIDDGMDGKKHRWISLGTYGYNHHCGKDYKDIISDWAGYKDWTEFTIKDMDKKNIKSGKR